MSTPSTAIPGQGAVVRRLYAKGEFVLDTAAHFGGGDDSLADMTLLRAPDGTPFIPGPSIAGAAQAFLAGRLLPWADYLQGRETWRQKLHLFGYDVLGPQSGRVTTMSPLFVSDAHPVNGAATAIRDGVRLDRPGGVAADQAKFDYEVVEAGSRFLLELECVIRDSDPRDALPSQFAWLLAALRDGEILLGKRTARGLGRGRVAEWQAVNLDMARQDHVLLWLHGGARLWQGPSWNWQQLEVLPDHRSQFRIDACCDVKTSLLIREAGLEQDGPDFRQQHSAGKPLIPGSSLAGAFRSQVGLIARTLWQDDGAAQEAMSDLFGPVSHAGTPPDQGLWRSRCLVNEEFVEGGFPDRKERVAIDRFTGGSLDAAKFNEEPLEPGNDVAQTTVRIRLVLDNPQEWEIGLLLLALKDFWLGRAGIGGQASLGRGLLTGRNAELSLRDGQETSEAWLLVRDTDAPLRVLEGDAKRLAAFVTRAGEKFTMPSGSPRPWSRRPVPPSAQPDDHAGGRP